jgi:hypothetical protein
MTIRIVLICASRPCLKIQLFLDGVPDYVFQAANSVLHFTFGLVSLALRLQLGVANDFADRLFYSACDLLRRSCYTILVPDILLFESPRNGNFLERWSANVR